MSSSGIGQFIPLILIFIIFYFFISFLFVSCQQHPIRALTINSNENKDEQKELQARYERGGEGYGHFKMYLKELIYPYHFFLW